MGLAEIDWVTTLNCIDLDEVEYEDFITVGNRLAKILRDVHKCDFVIALTHLRNPNDKLLATHCAGIDFILGGHDHVGFSHPDLSLAEVQWGFLCKVRNRLSKYF
jgi:5'-nucleotidase